jgi:hypothetical protein
MAGGRVHILNKMVTGDYLAVDAPIKRVVGIPIHEVTIGKEDNGVDLNF